MNKFACLVICTFLPLSVSASLKIATYNIKMYDSAPSSTNKAELKRIISDLGADFLTVQEIVNARSFVKFIKKEFSNYSVHLSKCGGGGRQKIGFVYRSDKFKLTKAYEDKRISSPGNIVGKFGCGRLRPALIGIFSEIKTKRKFVAIGVHLKAGGTSKSYIKRQKQYRILSRIVDELKLADYKNVLLMGDFNTTGFNLMDQDYTNFQNMLKTTETLSSSANLECTSYWSGRNRRDNVEESSVLDHVLYSAKFLKYKKIKSEVHSHCRRAKCEYVSPRTLGKSYNEVSDHCPVSVTFN